MALAGAALAEGVGAGRRQPTNGVAAIDDKSWLAGRLSRRPLAHAPV